MAVAVDTIVVDAIVLEVTTSGYTAIETRIRRMCKNLDINSADVHVHQTRSSADFQTLAKRREDDQTRTMLIFCDIEEGQGESARSLRRYLDEVWEATPPDWKAEQPVIIYSHDDVTYNRMKKASDRHASAVISQTPVAGLMPKEELAYALQKAIDWVRR